MSNYEQQCRIIIQKWYYPMSHLYQINLIRIVSDLSVGTNTVSEKE